jgi:hypothetical protein
MWKCACELSHGFTVNRITDVLPAAANINPYTQIRRGICLFIHIVQRLFQFKCLLTAISDLMFQISIFAQ